MLETIAFLHGKKWTSMLIKRTYFGNWLRDYSQAVDVGSLKGVNAETIRVLVWNCSVASYRDLMLTLFNRFGFSHLWLMAMLPVNSRLPLTVSASTAQKNISTTLSDTETGSMHVPSIKDYEAP
jgi:uncharacterized membrane protein YbaN (DUF454 family)